MTSHYVVHFTTRALTKSVKISCVTHVCIHEGRSNHSNNIIQVVSACHGSVVMVWELETGEKTMQFSKCHDDLEITAMSFDPTGRRLITGARDGSIKLWNFNNGACLLSLKNKCNTEVRRTVYAQSKLIYAF